MIGKPSIYVVKFKRSFLPLLFLSFTFCLLLFSSSNLPAVKSGLLLWVNSVVPSLFPFFVATELLMHTNVVTFLGHVLNPLMKPLFHIRGEGAFALIMGIISGYPVGAKIATHFRENNICSKEECERLLSFTNNSGPLFIIGTVGIFMFRNTMIGILLFVTHLLASLTVGILFRFWKKEKETFGSSSKTVSSSSPSPQNYASFSNLGEILAQSITSSISTILLIGGFVVIFSSVISILKASGILNSITVLISPLFQLFHINSDFVQAMFTGILEITNGIHTISNIVSRKLSISLIFVAFLLGFGGISVLLQVWSIVAKTDLSMKPYLYGKILQGFLASFYTYVLMNVFPFFNFDL